MPLSNGLLWYSLRYKAPVSTKLLLLLSSASLAVSGYYALIFLPLVPLGLNGTLLYGMALLALGPLVSFIYAKRLRTMFLEAIAKGEYQDYTNKEQFKWTGLKAAINL